MTASPAGIPLLDEDMMGRSAVALGFPHLLVCMGFVARTSTELYGVHLGYPADSRTTITAFWTWAQARGLALGAITDLYGCCNRTKRYQTTNNWVLWKQEMRDWAAILGYGGRAHGVDLAIIRPAEGTYVEYHLGTGSRHARIFYKRHEKTEVVGGSTTINGIAGDIASCNNQGTMRASTFAKNGIQGIASDGHKGDFHEVNYAMRLDSFTI
jgi:hypothetical protein